MQTLKTLNHHQIASWVFYYDLVYAMIYFTIYLKYHICTNYFQKLNLNNISNVSVTC